MAIEKLKKILKPVPEELRKISSHDKHDHWLVQEIGFQPEDYAQSTHILIGCPQDEGVRRNNGRVGAAEAPNRIREQLYKMQVYVSPEVRLFDAGNVAITDFADATESDSGGDNLKPIHNRLTEAVSAFLRDDKKVIVLGGGNDISYADVRALSEVHREISAINIDAHLDMRIADEMTSGTPYRRLIEEGILQPQKFYEFGIRPESNAVFYLEEAKKTGVNIHYLQQLWKNGISESFQHILNEIGNRPFFLGLDMDSIQASDAPGVSASSPTGFSWREVLQIIHHAKQKENLRIFEITEVNPRYDIDGRTSKLASSYIYNFLFG